MYEIYKQDLSEEKKWCSKNGTLTTALKELSIIIKRDFCY